jgi:hypothetical protein
MFILSRYPFVVLVLTSAVMWAALKFGSFVGSRRPAVEVREDLSMVTNASLTLLALIIGFTFSMAVGRYDLRKNYEEEEANAIGTEYVRVGMLPAADTARLQTLLVSYLDQRLLYYTTRDQQVLEQVDRETALLQGQMWTIVQNDALTQPTPISALVVSGMNDVLNRQGYTQAAWWNRIPTSAWRLMLALAICSSWLVGYGSHRKAALLLYVLPLLVAVSFFLIADLDSPRRGVIRVAPQNLLSLQKSLKP